MYVIEDLTELLPGMKDPVLPRGELAFLKQLISGQCRNHPPCTDGEWHMMTHVQPLYLEQQTIEHLLRKCEITWIWWYPEQLIYRRRSVDLKVEQGIRRVK